MPCKETDCKCELARTALVDAGLDHLLGHDKLGNCKNPTCGHPVWNHTNPSSAGDLLISFRDDTCIDLSDEAVEEMARRMMTLMGIHENFQNEVGVAIFLAMMPSLARQIQQLEESRPRSRSRNSPTSGGGGSKTKLQSV